MTEHSRIKVNVRSGEIEIEGSEKFVEKHIDKVKPAIEAVTRIAKNTLAGKLKDNLNSEDDTSAGEGNNRGMSTTIAVPSSFGEWFHKFPAELAAFEQLLIAAYFVQTNSDDNTFKTNEATAYLKENGVNVSNPSAFVSQLIKKKFVFQVKKEGSIKILRVSQGGEKEIISVMGRNT